MTWPTLFDTKLNEYDAKELPGQQLAAAHACSPLDHLLKLDIKAPPPCQRLTGIMVSIGSASRDIDVMEKMIAAGMNIAFLNMAFGMREDHVETINMLRQAARNYSVTVGKNYPLAIAIRLSGRKIRTGCIAESYGDTVELRTTDTVRLTTDETYQDRCSTYTIYVDFMYLPEQLKKGDTVLLDNETIKLQVEMISTTTITCKVIRGGVLGSYKDVFVPNVVLKMPNFSEKDKLDIDMAIRNQVDIVIATFVNSASTINELRSMLGEKGKKISIMANIQNIEGYRNFNEILAVTDSVAITRQELGSDITPKKLVIAQKNMIARANQANVAVCIIANLLSSMRYSKIPLRAELLDIGNCIMDGVDCLALCAETAVGMYPVQAVAYLANTCKEAEACIWSKKVLLESIDKTPLPCDHVAATSMAAVLAAQRCLASAIVVVSSTGKSVQCVSKYHPRCPIIAVTRYGVIARHLHMWKGIIPLIYEDTPDAEWSHDVDNRVNFCVQFAKEKGFVRIGDPVVVVSGWRQGASYINTMRVIYATADQ